MAKGTKDLRRATLLLLENAREKAVSRKNIIQRARRKEAINCKWSDPQKGLKNLLCDCESNVAGTCEGVCEKFKSTTEEWMIVCWELEIELIEDAIQTMEKWIVDDNYDY